MKKKVRKWQKMLFEKELSDNLLKILKAWNGENGPQTCGTLYKILKILIKYDVFNQ